MEENMTAAAEAATNGNEFDGWQDAGFDGAEEQAAETQATEEQAAQETSAQPEEGSNTNAEENGAEGAESASTEVPETAADQQQAQEQPLVVTYMNQQRTLSREEAVQFAQKGMDYDRIRERWDDAKDTIAFIDEQARAAGMDRKAFIDYLRIETKKSQGVSEEEARRTVELENREAVVHEQEAAEQRRIADQQAQQQAAEAAKERRNADFKRFAQKFPDVDAKDITPDIWARVGKGESLTEIWLEKENNRLKMEQAAAEQNAKNAGRSTGSMASSGGETEKKDPFDEGWD